jgi:hypothetical protein
MKVVLIIFVLTSLGVRAQEVSDEACRQFSVSPEAERLGGSLVLGCFAEREATYKLSRINRYHTARKMVIDRAACDCLRGSPISASGMEVGARRAATLETVLENAGGSFDAQVELDENIVDFNIELGAERNGMIFQASLLDPGTSPTELLSTYSLDGLNTHIETQTRNANAQLRSQHPRTIGTDSSENPVPEIQGEMNYCLLSTAHERCTEAPSCISPRTEIAISQIPKSPLFYKHMQNAPAQFNPADWNYDELVREHDRLKSDPSFDSFQGPLYERVYTLADKIQFLNANQLFKNLFSSTSESLRGYRAPFDTTRSSLKPSGLMSLKPMVLPS